MEGHATRTSAIALQRQEREDRLGCRYDEVRGKHPNSDVVGTGAVPGDSCAAVGIRAVPDHKGADLLALDELHERLGS